MFNWFKKKAEKKAVENVIPLVWNEDGVKLDTNTVNGDYEFEDFTGYIHLYNNECFVENASFIYHIGNVNYLKGTAPLRIAKQANRISVFGGIIKGGSLHCHCLENTTLNGGCVICNRADGNIINDGEFHCADWLKGTVNGGHIHCDKWRCGTFNDGTFKGEWHQGIFNNGTFNGEWYGGKWKDGTFNGEVYVGDGTFEGIDKVN